MTTPEDQGQPTAAAASSAPAPASYEQAFERLDQIIRRLDSGEAELRETLELCREGKQLAEYCRDELEAVAGELRELDLDALIASLESHTADS